MNFNKRSQWIFFKTGIVFVILILIQCKEDRSVRAQIEQIPVAIEIDRFDEKFAKTNAANFLELKRNYAYLFHEQYADSIWINRLQDTIQQEINKELAVVFSELDELETELGSFYQHLLFYFPKTKVPHIVTLSNYVQYKERIWLDEGFLCIALDNYLGVDHKFYSGFPQFVRVNLKPEQIVVDLANIYAKKILVSNKKRSFVSKAVQYGKELYLMQLLLSKHTPNGVIGYSKTQWKWAKDNELQMWRYFVERDLLFDTNPKLNQQFLNPAPFSKFYLELDAESPARIGRYLGWQIVNTFMQKTNSSLEQLLLKDNEALFQESNYKPNK